MDLYLDQEAFHHAREQLSNYLGSSGFAGLCADIRTSFAQLKEDWDTDAGIAFFNHFEKDLLHNLSQYDLVFKQIYNTLLTVSTMYEEVFRAAQSVVNTQI